MSKITLMAGTPQSLCRAWHALQALERDRAAACRASSCPAKTSAADINRRTPRDNT